MPRWETIRESKLHDEPADRAVGARQTDDRCNGAWQLGQTRTVVTPGEWDKTSGEDASQENIVGRENTIRFPRETNHLRQDRKVRKGQLDIATL